MTRDPRLDDEFIPHEVEEIIRDFMSPERAKAAADAAAERDREFRDSFISLMNKTGELRGDIAGLREDIVTVREQGQAQFRELKTDFLGLAARVSKTEDDLRTIRGVAVPVVMQALKVPWGSWMVIAVAFLLFVAAAALFLRR